MCEQDNLHVEFDFLHKTLRQSCYTDQQILKDVHQPEIKK